MARYTSKHTGSKIDATIDSVVNPNLLDDWCFLDVVNQRGKTSYDGAIYGFDRWKGVSSYTTVSIVHSVSGEHNVLRITGNEGMGSNRRLVDQKLENGELLQGREVTLSVLVDDIAGDHHIMFGSATSTSDRIQIESVGAPGLYSVTGVVIQNLSDAIVSFIRVEGGESGSEISVVAVKLELGSTQTLAHQDADGNWVLNEIPNYGEQLQRCQRYYNSLYTSDYLMSFSAYANNTTVMRVTIPLPTPMRDGSTVVMSADAVANVRFYSSTGTSITPTALASSTIVGNMCVLVFTVSGATSGAGYTMRFTSTALVEFNGEL